MKVIRRKALVEPKISEQPDLSLKMNFHWKSGNPIKEYRSISQANTRMVYLDLINLKRMHQIVDTSDMNGK